MNPYEINPTYETRNLRLRLVAMEDANDLLKCYSNPNAVELVRCLMKNKANGIVYRYDGQLVGDYDKCETGDKIFE